MANPKFGVCLGDLLMSATDCARLGPQVEAWGYDSIWMADHLVDIDGAVADPYAVFGYLTALTEKIFFCAAVSDCQRIHPAKMAHMIATLDELGGGRIGLGIGAGEAMSTIPFGLPFEDEPAIRLERLREYIQVVRALWVASPEEPASFAGSHYTLDRAWIDQRTRSEAGPPIHVGALGSKAAMRITAELGDGWLPFMSTPEYYRSRLEFLSSAAADYGRDPADIEAMCWVYLVMTDDAALADKALRDLAIFSVAERGSLKHAGFDLGALPAREYNFSRLLVADEAKVERLVETAASVPRDLVKKMHAVGSVDEVTDFFGALIDAGARHFVVNPCASPDVEGTLETFSSKVLPHFRAA